MYESTDSQTLGLAEAPSLLDWLDELDAQADRDGDARCDGRCCLDTLELAMASQLIDWFGEGQTGHARANVDRDRGEDGVELELRPPQEPIRPGDVLLTYEGARLLVESVGADGEMKVRQC